MRGPKPLDVPNTFVLLFPTTPTEQLIEEYGVSERTIMRWSKKLGLRKSAEYRSALARNRPKRTYAPKGEQHYNWKGGKPWKRFADPAYTDWRNAVLLRDNYTCQHCHESFEKRTRGLHAHHIKEYKNYPKLRFDISNGLTLCRWCHMKVHGKEVTREKIYCACGCGTLIDKYDVHKRERRYVNYHARRKSQ